MKKILCILISLVLFANVTNAAVSIKKVAKAGAVTLTPVGEWLFDNAQDLTSPAVGNALVKVGTGFSYIAGPTDTDGAVHKLKNSYFKLTHGIAPDGTYVNTYSILFDIKVSNFADWHSLLQTNGANTDDADLFVKNGGAGTIGVAATGYSSKTLVPNTWNRVVLVVNNGTEYSIYLNKVKILTGTVQAKDGRFGLRPDIILFGDNDGDDGDIDVARVSLYNKALTATEVQSLGGYDVVVPKCKYLTKPYLQNATTNGITVMWESDYNTPGTVKYGVSGIYGNSVTSTVTTTNANTYIHKVRIPSLQPATTYNYQVTSSDSINSEQSFKTATDDPNAAFKVGIWGDSHYANPFSKMASYLIDVLNVDFCFATGDLSNSGNKRTDIATVFLPQVLSKIGAKVPFYESFGNHDVGSSWGGGDLIRQYIDQPTLNNSDASKFSGSFAYTYGNSAFISVDWNRMETDLAPNGWVETFLKSSTSMQAKFRFIFIHNAPFYERWQKAENATVKSNIPLLSKKYGINAVFSGHMHGYERGYLDGVQYITQGGGSYMDSGEPVGPIIYPHIIVGTNKADNPANFNNGLTNHVMTLDITADKATAKLHYFDGSGNYQGVIESIEMTPRVPDLTTSVDRFTKWNCSIFPNPTTGIITVQAPVVVNVSVFNLKGNLIYSQLNVAPNSNLDLSSLKEGTYLIKLNNSTAEYSTTIIKQ